MPFSTPARSSQTDNSASVVTRTHANSLASLVYSDNVTSDAIVSLLNEGLNPGVSNDMILWEDHHLDWLESRKHLLSMPEGDRRTLRDRWLAKADGFNEQLEGERPGIRAVTMLKGANICKRIVQFLEL